MLRWTFRLLVVALLIGGVVGARQWYNGREKETQAQYRTASVTRGDVVAAISATGTVEPEEVINVGAQVAGMILRFGTDADGKTIDYGARVKSGMVLADIDDSLYKADEASANAQLAQAHAGVVRAQADLVQLRAKLTQAERDWERAQKLGPSEAMAQVTYDSYKAAYDTAKANVAVGDAAIVQANAVVNQAEASLARAQRNLGYCTIKSPVDGVIIDRRVNIGQTVVASLNAPSLFLLAKDLRRMQVWVAVNEADIGQVHPGQRVTFSVDAFPGETFTGEVGKVRLNAAMTQNVVNYTVEVTTDNSNGRLLPYLTANVQFEVGRSENVLLVPNTALRFTPRSQSGAPGGGEGRARASTRPSAPTAQSSRGQVWVQRGNSVHAIRVRTGLTDGTNTEVSSEELSEEMEVLVGERITESDAGTGAATPFTPSFPRGRGGGGRRSAG
jgi:HlyD family secretion protein